MIPKHFDDDAEIPASEHYQRDALDANTLQGIARWGRAKFYQCREPGIVYVDVARRLVDYVPRGYGDGDVEFIVDLTLGIYEPTRETVIYSVMGDVCAAQRVLIIDEGHTDDVQH